MSLYAYFSKKESPCLPKFPPWGSTLSQTEIERTNKVVQAAMDKKDEGDDDHQAKRRKYATYTATERAKIGKFAVENGTTRACKHFSQLWKKSVPEATARRFKNEYLKELALQKYTGKPVTELPTKQRGRPLLVGLELDKAIQALRSTGGVVNTAIVEAAAQGIISARCPGKLQHEGGDICIGKDWAKSLMQRMGFVKRKVSNAGKVLPAEYEELKEQFVADIAAEIILNDIPANLIINWDQTGLKIVPTGKWTMHLSGDKSYQS